MTDAALAMDASPTAPSSTGMEAGQGCYSGVIRSVCADWGIALHTQSAKKTARVHMAQASSYHTGAMFPGVRASGNKNMQRDGVVSPMPERLGPKRAAFSCGFSGIHTLDIERTS